MTRRDSIVIVTLVLTLSAIGGVVVVPGVMPAPSSPPPSAPPPIPVPARPYREGILSRPESVSPLTARTQADRDLVALVFSSLVRMGPDGSLVPDLAARWSVDPAGRVWTFVLRDDARWQDGEPVTAQDVAFTIHTLQDPAYKGPAASSWSEVTVSVVSPRVVSFTLATPLGGFLQAATQPIAPAHLLGRIPIALLPDHPFGWQPIGSGPFAVVSLDPDEAVLEPVGEDAAPGDLPTASLDTGDSLATPSLAPRPARVRPYLDGIRLRFYDDARALAGDFKAGALDAVSGLSGQAASDLAKTPSTRLLRYPGSTLTAVFLNLRPTHPEFRAAASRRALFEAIDRSRLVREAFGGAAATADLPIPRTWRFDDPAVDAATDTDRAGAAKALAAAGWKKVAGSWRPPGSRTSFRFELLSPDVASNPTAFAVADRITADWTALGLAVRHVALPAPRFAARLADADFSAAVVDVNVGLDPDLYPLLASSQTRTGGSNLGGVQDPALDTLLAAARGPGSDDQRKAAYSALERHLATNRYLLPVAFADRSFVISDTLSGPVARPISDLSDRYWDVLTWRLAVGR